MRTPSIRMRTVGVAAVVVLLATAGCLSGPLGAGATDRTTTTTTVAETTATTDETERTTGDGPGTEERSSTDGTEDPTASEVAVERADPADAPDLAAELPDPVACDGGWVGYWGTGDAGQLWQSPGELRIGWTVPANQSTLFVAFQNTTAVGWNHVEYDQPVTADGSAIAVEQTTGEGLYSVVMMKDVNGNGEYDPGVDRPCENDSDDAEPGAIVVTDWLWVDWNAES